MATGTWMPGADPFRTNIESLFPDIFDARTWNLDPLSAQSINWRQTIDKTGEYQVFLPRNIIAGWVQDDWTISPRLTLNLGVRYDLEENAFANDYALPPFVPGNRPEDINNVGPRMGFSFSANDATVIRGGARCVLRQRYQRLLHGDPRPATWVLS